MLRLKQLRQGKKLSQALVAEQLGVTQQAYANYERGVREADHQALIKLADFFGVTIDYLLGHSNQTNEQYSNIHSSIVKSDNSHLIVKNGEERELSEQETEILRIFGNLNVKQKAEVLLYLYEVDGKNKKG